MSGPLLCVKHFVKWVLSHNKDYYRNRYCFCKYGWNTEGDSAVHPWNISIIQKSFIRINRRYVAALFCPQLMLNFSTEICYLKEYRSSHNIETILYDHTNKPKTKTEHLHTFRVFSPSENHCTCKKFKWCSTCGFRPFSHVIHMKETRERPTSISKHVPHVSFEVLYFV